VPSSVAVLFFFCDGKDSTHNSIQLFLRTIIRQLLDQSEACRFHARDIYDKQTKESKSSLGISENLKLIQKFFQEFTRVFLVVDGLDEIPEKEDISEALKDFTKPSELSPLAESKVCSVNIILTSRLDMPIQRVLSQVISVHLVLGDNIHSDLELYVKEEIQSRIISKKLRLRDRNLGHLIQSTIINRAGT